MCVCVFCESPLSEVDAYHDRGGTKSIVRVEFRVQQGQSTYPIVSNKLSFIPKDFGWMG